MEINVNFLENLRLEAKFDDFTVTTDQPIRYKGDGSAPSPFDYFLASSALCAAYFVRVYCLARKIPTEDIRLSQNNIIDPENRYQQIFQIDVELPESISERDRAGILRSIDRCTVKKVVQANPEFKIETVESLGQDRSLMPIGGVNGDTNTMIIGKDLPRPCVLPTARGQPRKAPFVRRSANILNGQAATFFIMIIILVKKSRAVNLFTTPMKNGSDLALMMRYRRVLWMPDP